MGLFGPRKVRGVKDEFLTKFVDDVIALAQHADRELEKLKGRYDEEFVETSRGLTRITLTDIKRKVVREFFDNTIARADDQKKAIEKGYY